MKFLCTKSKVMNRNKIFSEKKKSTITFQPTRSNQHKIFVIEFSSGHVECKIQSSTRIFFIRNDNKIFRSETENRKNEFFFYQTLLYRNFPQETTKIGFTTLPKLFFRYSKLVKVWKWWNSLFFEISVFPKIVPLDIRNAVLAAQLQMFRPRSRKFSVTLEKPK